MIGIQRIVIVATIICVLQSFQIDEQLNIYSVTSPTVASIGYAFVAEANARISIGTTIQVLVDLQFIGFSQTDLDAFTQQFSKKYNYLNEYAEASSKKKINDGLHFTFGFLSLCSGGSYEDGYERQQIIIDSSSSQAVQNYVEDFEKEEEKIMRLKGNLTVRGTTRIPSERNYIFAEVLTINDKTIVSGMNPQIADATGSITGETNDTLSVLPGSFVKEIQPLNPKHSTEAFRILKLQHQ